MASKLSFSSSCFFCRAALNANRSVARTQIAHKSTVRNQNRKNSKTDFTVVQLLKPVPLYGDSGSYVSIPRGYMRHALYPRQKARYVVGDELKKLKTRDIKLERDRQFMAELAPVTPAQKRLQDENEFSAFAEFMSGEIAKRQQLQAEETARQEEELQRQEERDAEQRRKLKILSQALPKLPDVLRPNYIFQKPVNTATAQVDKNGDWKAGTPIFGSVTVADIIARLRESLSKDLDTATIVLEESNITLVSGSDEAEPDRLKSIGSFQVKIAIPGADETIMTTVQVLPDDSSDEALKQAREEARKAARPVMPKESAGFAFAKSKKRSAKEST